MEYQLTRLVRNFKQLPNDTECEVRVSDILLNNGNRRGLSFAMFEAIFRNIEKSCTGESTRSLWTKSSGKMHICDFFFKNDIRTRTRVGFPAVSVQKKRMMSVIGVSPDNTNIRFNFSLSRESAIHESQEQQVPIFVRMHQCWEFTYKDAFLYVLKKSVAGKTKEAAVCQEPMYEVEIELLPNSEYLNKFSDHVIAQSFILKALDLISHQNFETGEVLPLSRMEIDLTQKGRGQFEGSVKKKRRPC